ncbi:MAG: BstXI family restriction endonuclease [Coleofasciculaceae cyanobacterium SM2_1_6]|nr:BstXI family restriction endonuclease [Coleofasciculaceae cyanobacterium SM2_1_6]
MKSSAKGRSLPRCPKLLQTKIYKTGQTRGADDDVIYQNRVSRTSTVLIPYVLWGSCSSPPNNELKFENGFIVLISPETYFCNDNIDQELESQGLYLGINTVVFYEARTHWNMYNPEVRGWTAAQSRQEPLRGQYVARVPATTSVKNGGKIIHGFNSTSSKGAGIRLYEYASSEMISNCRLQLESLYWSCFDSEETSIENGMSIDNVKQRKEYIQSECQKFDLLDRHKLLEARILNKDGLTICPLCLERLSSRGFFSRLEQAEGREVLNLTVTQLNLFHIEELKYGTYNHRPYNLGWGHHHCNVTVKDSGIAKTIEWMYKVIKVNIDNGYFTPENKSS